MKYTRLFAAACSVFVFGFSLGDVPRVWMTSYGMKDSATFEKSVADCRAHGVDVVESATGDGAFCSDRLAICRKYGMKLYLFVPDTSKADMQAKKTGRYELAVMSGGCYKGRQISHWP